jgi:AcrR family transcriptional regulator
MRHLVSYSLSMEGARNALRSVDSVASGVVPGVASGSSASISPRDSWSPVEVRVLEATKSCIEQWGVAKVTIDDIAGRSGVSRATLYRLFPGGREVLFEALRVRETELFLAELSGSVDPSAELSELLVHVVVEATSSLRADEHLATLLATEPGQMASQLTVEGLPRIVNMASGVLSPLVEPHLDLGAARQLIDLLARIVISYFLAPSDIVDLADADDARRFLTPIIQAFCESCVPSEK